MLPVHLPLLLSFPSSIHAVSFAIVCMWCCQLLFAVACMVAMRWDAHTVDSRRDVRCFVCVFVLLFFFPWAHDDAQYWSMNGLRLLWCALRYLEVCKLTWKSDRFVSVVVPSILLLLLLGVFATWWFGVAACLLRRTDSVLLVSVLSGERAWLIWTKTITNNWVSVAVVCCDCYSSSSSVEL